MLSTAYPALKMVHAGCAALTLLLFVWRGRLSIRGKRISRRLLRLVPDSVDSILLGSGIALVFVTGQYPFVNDWVTLKLLAVIAYIALGFVALRFGRSRLEKQAAWVAAMLVFAGIVWLAHARPIVF